MKKFVKCLMTLLCFTFCLFITGCGNNVLIGKWYIYELEITINNEQFNYGIADLNELISSEINDDSSNKEKADFYAYYYYESSKDAYIEFKNNNIIVYGDENYIYKWKQENNTISIINNDEILNVLNFITNNEQQNYLEQSFDVETNCQIKTIFVKDV